MNSDKEPGMNTNKGSDWNKKKKPDGAKQKVKIKHYRRILTGREEALDIPRYEGQSFDRVMHATISHLTGYLSPISFLLATSDWLGHLSSLPAKQIDLLRNFFDNSLQINISTLQTIFHKEFLPCIECRPNDDRFKNELWEQYPFRYFVLMFLVWEKYYNEATTNIPGVSKHHLRVVNFLTRQMLDIVSPSNFPLTNPEILMATYSQNGSNFINGFNNFIEDISRTICKLPPVGAEKFKVGENLAITKGKVIHRNRLIELIQYDPVTPTVQKEPILIVPACIMKYYILDLSPHNSMVKYLIEQGHTVFMISWKNPGRQDRDLGFEEYINLGIMTALDVISTIIPGVRVNAVGYCLGGTQLMIAAAAMAAKMDDRLKTISLFAAEVDFREGGELKLFIDESQISYLEDSMWEKGYLEGSQMANAFSMLRSSELIWSRMVRKYLLGIQEPMFDLMAWDHDTTRLPYRMHSEYLRKLFLNNDLVEGQFSVWGRKIALLDINIPIFVVSTIKDHIAPWRSVYKIHLYSKADVTFVLTNGGHNAGIVSEPGHANRHYQIMTRHHSDRHLTPDAWQGRAPTYDGSWWPAWNTWLIDHSSKKQVPPPDMGNAEEGYPILCDAPGTYVMQK